MAVAAPPARPAELTAACLTWIHLDSPSLDAAQELADRFGWHPLDVEDVMSKRQRPKVDDYADEGYLFGVLHFPVYDRSIQRLNAAELDIFVGPDYLVTLPAVELLPVTRLFERCHDDERKPGRCHHELRHRRRAGHLLRDRDREWQRQRDLHCRRVVAGSG